MTQSRIVFEFRRRPSVPAYMARAFYPSPGLKKAGGFPPLAARWRDLRIDPAHLKSFLAVTGLRVDGGLPLLYPHVFGFPLLMALLTHPAFPLPIWNALQVRNHLLQHRPLPVDAVYHLESRVAGQRVLEKGAEADFHTTLHAGSELVWESLNTFYYRGRHGTAEAPSPLSRSPEVDGAVAARWHLPSGSGLQFGKLTGDYNGIHYARWYARLFGFPGPFHHPPSVIGQAMARLPPPAGTTQRLDTWLKGPVFYDIDAELRMAGAADDLSFAVAKTGDERAAIVGRWRAVPAGGRLIA